MTQHLSTKWNWIGFIALMWVGTANGAELYGDLTLKTRYSSNVYLNQNREADLVLEPSAALGVDFADIWSIGYQGALEAYPFHSDLLFHEHELSILTAPVFGENDEHELVAEAGVNTQRNTDTYASVNLLRPFLFSELSLEPIHWLRWSLSELASYRYFYDAAPNDSLDSWTRSSLTFTFQTKTTVSPRVAFGARFYPHPEIGDNGDQQLEAGLHLSQGVWEGAGLQLDYAYLSAFGDSVLILRNVTSEEFNYIGEDFLYTGHSALFGFKQLLDVGISFGLEVRFLHKFFGGWPALNSLGLARSDNADRTDQQLIPSGWIQYTRQPGDEAPRAVPVVIVGLEYANLRQWSNDAWYDTDRHLATFTVGVSW